MAGEFLAKAGELLAAAGEEFSPGSPGPLYKPYLLPKKSKLKFFGVPVKLGSQIVLRIYSESQIF